MIYLKLSIRNARRSFANYLLYAVTMTVLLAVMEVSDCIAVMGESAGFQTVSLPLLTAVIQIVLAGYMDSFMLKQRAAEFANYLLLGMEKRRLTSLFLCEIFLIGFGCYLAGTTIGFAVYGLCCFREPFHELKPGGFLYGKSMFFTFCYFCLIETICSLRLKQRLDKLQIKELMYEKNRSQSVRKIGNYKKWGMIFLFCFACLTGLMYGIAFLPEAYIVYMVSVVAIPLLLSIPAFYKWIFGCLYAYRRRKPMKLYQKGRLYILAELTSDFKRAAIINTIFCICLLFSACCFITGRLMLQLELQLFDENTQQWMGISQISICIVFAVIYFSILSLQQMIELRWGAKSKQTMRCLGKSNRQIERIINQQIAVKLTFPMIMVMMVFLFCMPLLNGKMNRILPAALQNILFKSAGEFFTCMIIFFLCYFGIVSALGRLQIRS